MVGLQRPRLSRIIGAFVCACAARAVRRRVDDGGQRVGTGHWCPQRLRYGDRRRGRCGDPPRVRLAEAFGGAALVRGRLILLGSPGALGLASSMAGSRSSRS